MSQVELNHANFCFLQFKSQGYSHKPNKSLMFGFLLSPVCVHWQCIGSQTCINRTCLSMCLCVYINAYQIRYSTKPLDWACIMQQVNLAKASIKIGFNGIPILICLIQKVSSIKYSNRGSSSHALYLTRCFLYGFFLFTFLHKSLFRHWVYCFNGIR